MTELIPVESSRISAYGYDEDTARVIVQFPDGVRWEYRNVPAWVWADFVAADSKGRFIHDVLDHYDHGACAE
jgi:hypothetical protein